jgi:alanine dehydrogenase
MFYSIGIPKEIKQNEKRVSIIPKDIEKFTKIAKVYVEYDAGLNSTYTDSEYEKAGAILCNKSELFSNANLIIKVKEPQKEEFNFIKENHIILTFFHFGGNPYLIKAMIDSKSMCIPYEIIQDKNKNNIILSPMSKLAGENSVIEADKFFKNNLTNIITIIGVGNVGNAALNKALELGYKNINLIDNNYKKLEMMDEFNKNINIFEMNTENLKYLLKKSNIIIGSIYVSGKETYKLINDDLLNLMPNNSLFIDVSIDQGGMTTQSKPTTYDNPIIKFNNVNLFCVANIPSIDGKKASDILSKLVSPYIKKILETTERNQIKEIEGLDNAITIDNGILLKKFKD